MNHLSQKWVSVYSELVRYKAKHGHTNVPRNQPEHRKLALWVKNQRFEYRTGKMNPRKIELLENLGFHWDLHRAKWFHMLEELKQFKARQGHCNVPQRVPEVARLSVWVSTQRLNFKKGRMSKERFLILENLGFDWAPHETKRLRRRQQREMSMGNEQSGFVLPTGTDFYL